MGNLRITNTFAGEYADYPKIAETSLSPKPSVSHALIHTARLDTNITYTKSQICIFPPHEILSI